MPQVMRRDAKFCSESCNEKAHALKRKLRVRGGYKDKPGYIRAYICERDGWRCQICGGKVSPDRSYPDPLFGSMDHIIPVSEGGDSSTANLRLAHLRCNLSRRDRGGNEQLLLIG
jgi:5-methylcytosine-specific restriction endonuclease McrA